MKHIHALNKKAVRVEQHVAAARGDVFGLCQPAERDLYDCYATCFWPAQVPDHLNNYPDWTKKCAAATKDLRNIELVFP